MKFSLIALLLLFSVTLFAEKEKESIKLEEQSSNAILSEELFKEKITNYSNDSIKINFQLDRVWQNHQPINKSEKFIIYRIQLFKKPERLQKW